MNNIVKDLSGTLTNIEVIPYDIGFYDNEDAHGQPNEYVVIVPLSDDDEFADNAPQMEYQAARISLFHRGDYLACKRQLIKMLREAGFGITVRRYAGFQNRTKHHHYIIEVEGLYRVEE